MAEVNKVPSPKVVLATMQVKVVKITSKLLFERFWYIKYNFLHGTRELEPKIETLKISLAFYYSILIFIKGKLTFPDI